VYIQFKRMKSASCQGASLFYDFSNFITCPVHALAVAIIMQTLPSQYLLDQLPRSHQQVEIAAVQPRPLAELLESRSAASDSAESEKNTDGGQQSNKASIPGLHAYVNRVLQKWSVQCATAGLDLTKGLSSHSFRRGAAQNANGNCLISTPWILDRGGWSMTSISKAFNYIVSTTQEDQQVGKSLAGWGTEAEACLPILEAFDAVVAKKIGQCRSPCLLPHRALAVPSTFETTY
jgi:hypothetical protein